MLFKDHKRTAEEDATYAIALGCIAQYLKVSGELYVVEAQ
jgi:hypothetical protein